MLLRCRVANHRSLRDEQELSLVAAPRRGEKVPAGLVPSSVRVAGIYGANAAGKSNVLSALRFMIDAVRDSYGRWEPAGGVPREPFFLDARSPAQPSVYEVDLLLQGVRYQFGFETDDDAILAEWLYSYP